MARKRREGRDMLAEMREMSASFSAKATVLSQLLIQAEEFFNAMPGKIEVETDDYGPYQLALSRVGKVWKLLLYEQVEDRLTTYEIANAPIRIKAEAAKLLPALFERLTSHLNDQRATVEEGLEALKQLPFLDLGAAMQSLRKDIVAAYDDAYPGESAAQSSLEGGFPDDEIPF